MLYISFLNDIYYFVFILVMKELFQIRLPPNCCNEILPMMTILFTDNNISSLIVILSKCIPSYREEGMSTTVYTSLHYI